MSVIALNTIKTQIQTNLAAANTTTASPLDLSNGLESRVKEIMTVNPELIPIQGERLPSVTIWLDSKSVDPATIANSQLDAKRKATLIFKIAGAMFRSIVSDYRTDEADDEAAILMENIEQVLREDPQLSGNVLWQYPVGIEYFNSSVQEETFMRVGILTLETTLFY